ncbi:MAG: hypothetical protein IPP95_11310 [Flavobacteriales bacterium]|nr:MAG: hypothetical protein IPP95_11310 [Flavobacteriales bacterium]
MTRTLLLLVLWAALVPAFGQQARLDRLIDRLSEQPGPDTARMNTLVEMARVYATINYPKALDAAHEAWRIADRLDNDEGRAAAWTFEAYAHIRAEEFAAADSVNKRAMTITGKGGHPRLLGYNYWFNNAKAVWGDTTANYRQEMAEAIRLLRSVGDDQGVAEVLVESSLFILNTDVQGRKDSLEKATAIYEANHDLSGLAQCEGARLFVGLYADDTKALILALERALAMAERDGNLWVISAMQQNLGFMFIGSADYERGLQYTLASIRSLEAQQHEHAIGELYANVGYLLLEMNDTEAAGSYFRTALTKQPSGSPNTLIGLAIVCLRQQKPDSALFHLDKARAISSQGDNEAELGEIEGWEGDALAMKGDTVAAITHYEGALRMHRRDVTSSELEARESNALGNVLLSASAHVLAATGNKRTEARAHAESLFTRALELGRKNDLLKPQEQALRGLARSYDLQGNPVAALDFFKQYAVIKDSTLNIDKAKAVALLSVQYETEKKEQEIVLLGKDKEVQAKEIQKQKLVRNGFMGGFALVALFAGVFFFQRNRISKARKRSDELLLNILPAEVAEELKEKGEAEARLIPHVTVLFTDFKGFTAMSEQLSPKQLVKDLHECFSAFDGMMERHGLEKIKTIGDAYMAAGGLPVENSTHAEDAVRAAFEMRDFIAEGRAGKVAAGLPFFEIRIGIHTGPVVAGIVGVKKFAYDIWGDTVNTASRMESSGEVGQVNISEATYALVKGEADLTFTPRGKVQAKGKGEMEMYFVNATGSVTQE